MLPEERGILMLPSTPKIYRLTKRELFARRMNLMDRPLVILNFQGVLGDFIKDNGLNSLNFRYGAVESLKMLTQHFQVVVYSRETVEDSWSVA